MERLLLLSRPCPPPQPADVMSVYSGYSGLVSAGENSKYNQLSQPQPAPLSDMDSTLCSVTFIAFNLFFKWNPWLGQSELASAW